MRDNYIEIKRIPLGAMVATGLARAGHERMAGKHFRNSGRVVGPAVAIAVFPPSATDRAAGRARQVSDRDALANAPLDCRRRRAPMHADIQPANLMHAAQSDMVEVTGFGIARIADSRRSVAEPVAQAQG